MFFVIVFLIGFFFSSYYGRPLRLLCFLWIILLYRDLFKIIVRFVLHRITYYFEASYFCFFYTGIGIDLLICWPIFLSAVLLLSY